MPSPAKEIKDTQALIDMINMRIIRQKKLLDKIACGKWKQSQVTEEVLYALTKHDLKKLEQEALDAHKRLTELKRQMSVNNVHP